MLKRGGDMVKMESVTIKVPAEMKKYIVDTDAETDLVRNALLLYPYILNPSYLIVPYHISFLSNNNLFLSIIS